MVDCVRGADFDLAAVFDAVLFWVELADDFADDRVRRLVGAVSFAGSESAITPSGNCEAIASGFASFKLLLAFSAVPFEEDCEGTASITIKFSPRALRLLRPVLPVLGAAVSFCRFAAER